MAPHAALLKRYLRELKALVYLASPILVAQLATAGIGFVDTSMAGQYAAKDLAAIALGSSIWVPICMLIRGVLMATTPMVAHLYGAGRLEHIGSSVCQAFWIALVLGLLTTFSLRHMTAVLAVFQVDPVLTEYTSQYLTAVSWGMPAVCCYQVLVSYCEGMGHTKPAMVCSVAALLLNIPLNTVLIYGKLGLPELGGVGCGYATAICFWFILALLFSHTRTSRRHRATAPYDYWAWPNYTVIARYLRLGIPIGLTIFFEVSIFAVTALAIGQLGTTTIAGHQVALNFAGLVFMVPLSLSMAMTIRVGQMLGASQPQQAAFVGYAGIGTTALAACVSALVIGYCPQWIAAIYTDDPTVSRLAVELLMFAALFQLADGIQAAANGALRGYKDARIPMLLILVAYWLVALPLGYILGLTAILTNQPMGPHGLWIGLLAGLSLAAVLLTVRLRMVSHRRCTVAQATTLSPATV